MGWPEVAGKSKNQRQTEAAAVVFSGQMPARSASVGGEISRPVSSGGGAPPRPARVARW